MIDKEPAEGRFLLRSAGSTAFYPWYEPGGLITKVAGKRVYYKDADLVERFTVAFGAVCDTKEEYKRLLKFSEDGKRAMQQLREKLQYEEVEALAGPSRSRRSATASADKMPRTRIRQRGPRD